MGITAGAASPKGGERGGASSQSKGGHRSQQKVDRQKKERRGGDLTIKRKTDDSEYYRGEIAGKEESARGAENDKGAPT